MAEEENPNEMKEEVTDIAPFDPTKKKKKKKVVIQDPADDSVDKLAEKAESLSVSDALDSTFSGLKKKKKKLVLTDVLNDQKANLGDDLDDHIGEDEGGEGLFCNHSFHGKGVTVIMNMRSFWAEFLIFFVRIIQSLLEIDVGQL
ncbi:hypothetical protein F0562_021616 [Nyssa sinensis]|uniref:Uncharacterized protein n=1 Tax=Nyssa sinensis TaxID=561372 RepID=A0A5J5BLS3_9ASTE|nr:hypothetical protein F0562_021616 [Nyssa sinensis]